MTIGQLVIKILGLVEHNHTVEAGKLACQLSEKLRFEFGMNYKDVYNFVKRYDDRLTLAAWDEILQEG